VPEQNEGRQLATVLAQHSRLNQTAICALELLRLGARKESKKKTVVRRVSRERNSAEVKSKTKLEVLLLEIKWAGDLLCTHATKSAGWEPKAEHCNHKN
jgi:hypothetical protein